MAFTVTETELVIIPGGTAKLYGTYVNTGGSTGGVLSPGLPTNTNYIAAASGIRMKECDVQPSSASPAATRYVYAYNATTDTRECTITTAADETGAFVIEGDYRGVAGH